MATENPSRQQSGERSSTGSSTAQQGTGTGNPAGGTGSQQQAYGSSTGQAGATTGARGTQQSYGGTTGQGAGWQERGNRGAQYGTAMPTRRGSSFYEPSLYSGYGRGYGAGPFSLMRRISDEMERLFENFGMGTGMLPQDFGRGWSQFGTPPPALWTPHIEVRERDGKLLIQADLPGVRKEDVKVEIEQDQVIIQGQREQEQTENERGYYHTERSYGSFYRAIQLPEGVNTENAKASFRDGVLEIEVPAPQQRTQTRRLEIQDAGSKSGGTSQNR